MLVDRFIVSPLAAGDAVLTEDEREAGVRVGPFADEVVVHRHQVDLAEEHLLTQDVPPRPRSSEPVEQPAFLLDAGFAVTAMGLQLRTSRGLRPRSRPVRDPVEEGV